MKKEPANIFFRRLRAGLLIPLVALLLLSSPAGAGGKKGVGLADLRSPERVAALNVDWYYTWKPEPIEGAPPEKFVPMIWGGKVPILLAINEPDKPKQANMSVEEVIRAWPAISRLADQVGTPAAAGVLGAWFDKFYRMAKARGLKMDFMAVHWYGPPNAEHFLKKIDSVYEKYGLPIWITEFAVADWGARDTPGSNRFAEVTVLEFMKQVLPELERRPYILRYAWYGAGKKSLTHEQVRTSRLFEKDGSLTSLGRFYADYRFPAEKELRSPAGCGRRHETLI